MENSPVPSVLLALVLGVTLAGCLGGSASVAPDARVLVAFGDSVTAGHGLGDATGWPRNPTETFSHHLGATRGMNVFSMGITGACTGTTVEGHENTSATCRRSILKDQLPAVTAAQADLIIVTTGANDIYFAGCLESFLRNDKKDDPCRPERLAHNLTALEMNLAMVISTLRERFGAAVPIVFTQYYNPFPPPTTNTDHACDLWFPAAIAREPHLVLAPHDSSYFRTRALAVQEEAWEESHRVLGALNARIRDVAAAHGAASIAWDFAGHDLCATIRGASIEETWVYGPEWQDGIYLHDAAVQSYASRPMPETCDGAWLDGEAVDVRYGFLLPDLFAGYRIEFVTNCLPHPTASGHRAMAEQLDAALRDLGI